MTTYPQLESGALSQFPVQKTRRARTVMNQAADGSTIKLADPAGMVTEWTLTYVDLSDAEATALWDRTWGATGSGAGGTSLDPPRLPRVMKPFCLQPRLKPLSALHN